MSTGARCRARIRDLGDDASARRRRPRARPLRRDAAHRQRHAGRRLDRRRSRAQHGQRRRRPEARPRHPAATTPERTDREGQRALAGNDVRITPDSPLLAAARGRVDFSHKGFAVVGAQRERCSAATLAFDGGTQADGSLRFSGQGSASAEALRRATELGVLARAAALAERPGRLPRQPGLRARPARAAASRATSSAWRSTCRRRCAKAAETPLRAALSDARRSRRAGRRHDARHPALRPRQRVQAQYRARPVGRCAARAARRYRRDRSGADAGRAACAANVNLRHRCASTPGRP